jgi:hypothetical protein
LGYNRRRDHRKIFISPEALLPVEHASPVSTQQDDDLAIQQEDGIVSVAFQQGSAFLQ